MTYKDIVSRWPSVGDLASDLNVPADLVRKWVVRNRIPVGYWHTMTKAAEKRHIKLEVSEMVLLEHRKENNG